MSSEPETNAVVPSITARDLLYVVFGRKRLIVTFFACTVLAALLYALLASPTYESTAKLLVRSGRESVSLDATAMTGKTVNVSQTMQALVKSEMEIINSQGMAEKVVDAIGPGRILDPPPDPPQQGAGERSSLSAVTAKLQAWRKAAQRWVKALKEKLSLVGDLTPRQLATQKVMGNLDIEGVFDSDIIVITSDAATRTMAQRVLDELLTFYLAKHMEVYQSTGSYEFFRAQAEQLEKFIAAKDAELQWVKKESRIISLAIQQPAVAQRIATLRTSIQETEAALAIPQAKIAALASMRAEASSPDKRWQMQQLVKDEDELIQKNEMAELRAKLATYEGQLAGAEEERRRMTDQEGKIEQLEHELEISRATYKTYRESAEKARIDNVLQTEQISNISVVQAPTRPLAKVGPLAVLAVMLGIIVGLMGGVGLAFLFEYLDHSVTSAQDVERHVRLPTLATLPFVRRSTIRPRNRARAGESDFRPVGHPTPVKMGIPTPLAEPLHALRQRLLLLAQTHPSTPKVIGLSSSYPREGVTTISSLLAMVLAENGTGRVLLVDANLGDPSIHRTFDVSVGPGLRDMLSDGQGGRARIQPTAIERLDLLPAGEPNSEAPAYDRPGLSALFADWRQAYDFVLIDMPSFGSQSVFQLAGLVDGVLLVVEAHRVRWQAISRLRDNLQEVGANILGIVLNKRRYPIPNWLYRRL